MNADQRLAEIESRMDVSSERMDLLDASMKRNTDLTQEIRDILDAARVGFKVLGGLGTLVKWAGPVLGGALAIYTFVYAILHDGAIPK